MTSEGKSVRQTLLESIKTRLFPYETRSVPKLATILDPRFKKDGFRTPSNADEAIRQLENEMHLNNINMRNFPTVNELIESNEKSLPMYGQS